MTSRDSTGAFCPLTATTPYRSGLTNESAGFLKSPTALVFLRAVIRRPPIGGRLCPVDPPDKSVIQTSPYRLKSLPI